MHHFGLALKPGPLEVGSIYGSINVEVKGQEVQIKKQGSFSKQMGKWPLAGKPEYSSKLPMNQTYFIICIYIKLNKLKGIDFFV